MKVSLKSALLWGAMSHALAGALPFVAGPALKSLGVFTAASLFYLVSAATVLTALLVSSSLRERCVQAIALVVGSRRCVAMLVLMLLLFSVGMLCYYQGLNSSRRVTEFVFLSRLDWAVQLVVASLLLRENRSCLGWLGAALAICGGLIASWQSVSGTEALPLGLGYVLASAFAYVAAQKLIAKTSAGFVFAVRTVGLCLLLLALTEPGKLSSAMVHHALAAVVIAGLLLSGIFVCRFHAMSKHSLWLLAALGPVQIAVAVIVGSLVEGRLSQAALLGAALIACGEFLVAKSLRNDSKQALHMDTCRSTA